ncbi:MAG TPA: PVC-type heme-binding CxxCH protein, partial [Isosphaeraceae bacterium]|nr:PVC-type heme-binding CxxCH protein [Isosphaeraceae bacterium]
MRRSLLYLTLFTFALATRALPQDDDLARELPRLPPTEPADALTTFRLHKGFQLAPIATEPQVTDPVAAAFDADGRLYVVEMRGYPYPEKTPSGNVSLLEDPDGDGTFDKATIFVDGLSWPTGVVPFEGGVFIAVAPDILYAKDTDGDGRADVRKVMFTGFGTQNVQGLVNGLLWGPDGWIYGSSGSNGGEIKNLAHPDRKPVSVRGRDFRFKPDGSACEAISGGGQFGHSFDDWGHRFVCNNSNHIRQIVLPAHDLERNPALAVPAVLTDIAVEGGAAPVFRISPPEPWRVVRTRQRAADPSFVKRAPPTELVATGFFTSATGITIYRGTAFPPEYQGNAFIGDVGGNLVHRKILFKQGAIFQAERADKNVEFLASTDNWFRPVNFTNTPDGTLLILDMYRETIEHPESIPEPIKKHLDLTSGKDRGRIYNLVPEGFHRRSRPALSKASIAELVQTLADRDAWWRETAQRLLIERQDGSAIALLKPMVKNRPSALGRVHALWTLDALGKLEADDLLLAHDDADANVREQFARLAGRCEPENGALTKALAGLADDPDAMVRFQTALALGDRKGPELAPALAKIAAQDAGDPWTRAAVLSSLDKGREEFLAAIEKNVPGFFTTPNGRIWLGELAVLIGAANHTEEVERLLDRFAGPEADPGVARAVVLGLGRGLQRAGGSLRSLREGPAARFLRPLLATAAQTAEAEGAPAARADAIRLLGLGSAETALNVLPPLLDARQPTAVQLAVLQAMVDLPDKRVGPAVIERWKALSPAVRREATELLFARADRVAALVQALETKAIAVTDLDPARRKQLLTLADPRLRARAETLLGGEARPDRGPVLAAYRGALDLKGDPSKGKAVFTKVC